MGRPSLLSCILAHLNSEAHLAAASRVCRAMHSSASSHSSDGGWHALCERRWPSVVQAAEQHEESLRAAGAAAALVTLGAAETPERSVLSVDWQVLLRERVRHVSNWRGENPLHVSCFSGVPHTGQAAPVYGIRMQGDVLLTSSEDATMCVWDLATRRGQPKIVCAGHDHGILGAWLDADGQRAVSGGFDSTLRLWDLTQVWDHAMHSEEAACASGASGASRTPTRVSSSRVFAGHSGPIVSIEGNRNFIFSTSFDGTCRIWEWAGKQVSCIFAHEGHASGLELTDGGAHLLTGGDDGLVKQWDTSSGETIFSTPAHNGAVWCVRHWEPSGVTMSAGTDGSLKQWDMRAGAPLVQQQLKAHDDAVAGLQLDDHKIVTSGFDSTVRIWDLRRGLALVAKLDAPMGTRCTRLAYDEDKIVTGSLAGTVCIFDVH